MQYERQQITGRVISRVRLHCSCTECSVLRPNNCTWFVLMVRNIPKKTGLTHGLLQHTEDWGRECRQWISTLIDWVGTWRPSLPRNVEEGCLVCWCSPVGTWLCVHIISKTRYESMNWYQIKIQVAWLQHRGTSTLWFLLRHMGWASGMCGNSEGAFQRKWEHTVPLWWDKGLASLSWDDLSW